METEIIEAPVKIKRGRGRPRKNPLPLVVEEVSAPAPAPPHTVTFDVEELIHPDQTVDTRDIARAPPPQPPPMPESVDEAEVIRLPTMDEDERGPGHRPLATVPHVFAMPPAAPVEDAAARRSVLSKIKKYRESFDAVRAMKFDEEWPLNKLEAHLEDVRIAVGSKSSHVLVKHTYLAAIRGVEMATCAAGMKTYGLVSVLQSNSEVDNALKQLAAEIGIGSVPPGHRLAIATIGAVLALDSANRKAEVLAGFKAEPVNESIQMKYESL